MGGRWGCTLSLRFEHNVDIPPRSLACVVEVEPLFYLPQRAQLVLL
jgi:hypothetical protein